MAEVCENCDRPVYGGRPYCGHHSAEFVVKATVEHGGYGCDTGCCGHQLIGFDAKGREVDREFTFGHPYRDDSEAWARDAVKGQWPKAELDWDESDVSDD